VVKAAGLRLRRVKIKNNKDVDMVVKDAFGAEHVLYPREEMRILVLKKEKQHGK